jgi:cellulose biosynthesis protein BcsQ
MEGTAVPADNSLTATDSDAELEAALSAWALLPLDAVIRNVVAVMIRKGGAGKTTLILLLADALARMGLRVLLIDTDPQGNLSSACGCKVHLISAGRTKLGAQEVFEPDRNTIVDVLDSDTAGIAAQAISIVPWAQFYEQALGQTWDRGGPLDATFGEVGIIPCYEAIETQSGTWAPADLQRLAKALRQPSEDGDPAPHRQWDVVLIDTPPSGNNIPRQGALSADFTLLVTNAERFGMEAIPMTLKYINDVRSRYGHPQLQDLGLIFNDYDPRRRVVKNQTADLVEAQARGAEDLQVELWEQRIPVRGVIADAQDAEAPVSALLGDSGSRKAATVVCKVAESVAIRILREINHPRAAAIEERWTAAWPADEGTH